MGEAVAAVAAETEELAEQAARAIKVEYDVLPVLTDPIEAMKPGAVPIYDTVLWGENEIEIERNIACDRSIEQGDVDRAFAEADLVVEGNVQSEQGLSRTDGDKICHLPPRAKWWTHYMANNSVDSQCANPTWANLRHTTL